MFIVIEGIDGSGKTTFAKALSEAVGGIYTKEPTDFFDDLMKYSNSEEDAYVADRIFHLRNEILPAMEAGEIVVCDRYIWSNIAYQAGNEMDIIRIWEKNNGLPAPDLIFFCDVPVPLALSRIEQRGKRSKFESKEKLELVLSFYRKIMVLNEEIQTIRLQYEYQDKWLEIAKTIIDIRRYV